MNIYDIAIGFIIGVGVERATRLSHFLQKEIKKYKEAQKAKRAKLKEGVASATDNK